MRDNVSVLKHRRVGESCIRKAAFFILTNLNAQNTRENAHRRKWFFHHVKLANFSTKIFCFWVAGPNCIIFLLSMFFHLVKLESKLRVCNKFVDLGRE